MNFNRSEHVYSSPNLEEIIKDTVRFFNGTPVYQLPPPERFHGTGIYAIYCIAKTGVYSTYHQINRLSFNLPIYVGKAVPRGWRQTRTSSSDISKTYELYSRLREHSRSIEQGADIELENFLCRFMILEGSESDLIGTVEAALIRAYKPLWNTIIDGFGNHDPGKGRYNQAKSDWDVCHPGRPWAEKCLGVASGYNEVNSKIFDYLSELE
ncbi:MAG: Eco29kI family restriction endonuclease [Chloroflexi bacterium]|nr:Eco29kI family restriction endonuclease [Chloroflexota bacterium]